MIESRSMDIRVLNHTPAWGEVLPILLSSPHSGGDIPSDLQERMSAEALKLPDTDLWIHKLYDFAPAIGIEMIDAVYSRYVVDLNRHPDPDHRLYKGRKNTGLVPEICFDLQKIYKEGQEPDHEEVLERQKIYHQPYHDWIKTRISQMLKQHEKVLFFDAHSIRSRVDLLGGQEFPELILGNANGQSCPDELLQIARSSLEASGYEVSVNHPFQGGYLTRSVHTHHENCYSLQLEMSRRVYLADDEESMDTPRWEKIRSALSQMFLSLSACLKESQ